MIKFGTDGWRALIARQFTFDNLGLVVQAIGEYLKEKEGNRGLFIGYDNRFLSEEFAHEAGRILTAMDNHVLISSEAVPTPVTAFMVRELGMGGAIMITASHNPPQYNGIKFIPDYGGPADSTITDAIEEKLDKIIRGEIRRVDIKRSNHKKIKYIDDYSSYTKKLLALFDLEMIKDSGLKVAADIMNGAAYHIFPEILNDHLALENVIINDQRDPLFGGRLPDPSEKNLDPLKKIMDENDSDIGLALDGDADRFGVIDKKGVFLNPNNVISLCLYYMLETRKYSPEDCVVRTVATTHLLDAICSSNNINLLEQPVGFKYIGKKMLDGNIIIGGEESGGLSIKGHIPEKDGLLAHVMLLEIQSYLIKNYGEYYLSDYLGKIYSEFGTFHNTRLDIEIPGDKKKKVIGYFSGLLGDRIDGVEIIDLVDIDGSKLIFNDGSWILARPSGTEPIIRCYIESKDEGFFNRLKDYVNSSISDIIG